jgi:glycerol-3-phosphate acyltransferase PlsY
MSNFNLLMLLFLIGAIPSGPIVCYLLALKDPSTYGSKNTGATNVSRQNNAAGALTLLLDFSKGLIPLLALGLDSYWIAVPVLGHCFSPFLKLKGGKGVATALGGIFAHHFLLGATILSIFCAAYSVCQNVGISSIICCIILSAYALLFGQTYLLMLTTIILIRHHENYQKLRIQQLWNPLF